MSNVRPRSLLSRRSFLMRIGLASGAAIAANRAGIDIALAQDEPVRGGTLTFAHFGDVDNYDPLTQGLDLFQNYGRLMVFSSLTRYDVDLALVSDLAESWEADGSAWVFSLRDGVTWHDGSPFTANDVKYTIERLQDPEVGSFLVDFIGTEAQVQVIDPHTVRFVYPEFNASFPDTMTAISIVKDGSGESNRQEPIGTGPFKFGSWSPNEETIFLRNDAYYVPGVPYLDEVIFRPIPDAQVAITNLTAGSVEAVSNQLILPTSAATLENQVGIQLITVDPSTALAYADFMANTPPFDDKRVRQGIAMCLDLEGIRELTYAGTGTPTNNWLSALSWAYTELPNYPYDPEAARALFTEAGYPDGFDITIDTIEGYADLIQIASIWQDGLGNAGINAQTRTNEISAWIDRYLSSDYQLTLNFDVQGPDPQRFLQIDYLLHISLGNWSDQNLIDAVTRLSDEANGTDDIAVRKAKYAELQTLLHDELPVIPIYRPALISAAADYVEGYALDGKGFYHFEKAWLT